MDFINSVFKFIDCHEFARQILAMTAKKFAVQIATAIKLPCNDKTEGLLKIKAVIVRLEKRLSRKALAKGKFYQNKEL